MVADHEGGDRRPRLPPPRTAEAFAAVYRQVVPDLPLYTQVLPSLHAYSALFTRAAEGMRTTNGFGDPEQWRFDWEQSYSREQWLDQVPTFGGHSQFLPAKLEELPTGIGAAIDAVGGSFTMRYTAAVVTAERTGPT